MKYQWLHCDTCRVWTTRCPKCGNNSCNGGYGQIEGKPCDACPEAYNHASKGYSAMESAKVDISQGSEKDVSEALSKFEWFGGIETEVPKIWLDKWKLI